VWCLDVLFLHTSSEGARSGCSNSRAQSFCVRAAAFASFSWNANLSSAASSNSSLWQQSHMRLRSPSARVLCCQRCAFQPFTRGYTVAAQSPSSQPNDVELPPRKKRPKTRISRWTDKQRLTNFFNTQGKDLGVAQVRRSIDPSTKLAIEMLKIIYYFVHILAI